MAINRPPLPCDRCGRPLAPGAPRYALRVRLTSDFDGVLPEPAPGETVLDALGACLTRSEAELEAEVDLALAFVVCPRCRDAIARDPLGRGGEGGGFPSGALH